MPLCQEFADIFALDPMTVNNFYTQKLRIKDETPVYTKNYRIPHSQKEEITSQVNKLLKNEFIEPSASAYNSPLLLVPKPALNGQKRWRLCLDYRAVNRKLIADKFPLPRIDEILDNLGRATSFSKIDLFQGFWQIPLDPDSRDMTSFSTDKGSFRWKVLPFGLSVSPNSFSRMMAIAFAGIPPEKAFLYVDDAMVIGRSDREHLQNLRTDFEVFRKYNLKIHPRKCEFFKPEVTFLGHLCTPNGILPDPSKLSTIRDYPVPQDKDAVRRFVAFANYYRRFIENFATLTKPMSYLTKKDVHFRWTKECDENFLELKKRLMSPTILAYPDFSKQFVITVDASVTGCGAVLSQMHGNSDLPIAFVSKSWSKADAMKSTPIQECLAIHYALTQFRPYVYGTPFLVKTDHRSLIYLFTHKNLSPKLMRIRLDLEEYDCTIEHISGKKNVVADALSRIKLQDIVDLYGKTTSVLAITRSMAKKGKDTLDEDARTTATVETGREELVQRMTVIESLEASFDKSVPRVRCDYMHHPTEQSEFHVTVYKGHRRLVKFLVGNMKVEDSKSVGNILKSLDDIAIKHDISKIQ